MPQDHRIQSAIDAAIEAGVGLLPIPEGMEATAEVAIAYAVSVALKALGIETGKVSIEVGADAKIKVSVR